MISGPTSDDLGPLQLVKLPQRSYLGTRCWGRSEPVLFTFERWAFTHN